MSITSNNLKVREIINQVVKDPEYKAVSSVPLISWPQLALIIFSYVGVFGSIALYLFADLSIWFFYPIMIFAFYTSFTPLHDATHRAVSSNKFLNDLLGTISGTLLIPFATTGIYRFLHLSHHRYVGDEHWDPDDGLVVIPRKYFPIGYLILLFPDVLWIHWLIFKAWKRVPVKTRISTLAMFTGLLVFNVFFLAGPWWYEYLILFLIPNRLGMGLVAYAFAHIQHPEGIKWNDHPLQTTYKLKGNRFFLQSFWGQAHHAMHHFLPHVPWFKYERVWGLANGIFRRQGIPERGVFIRPDKDYKNTLKKQMQSEKKSRFKVKVTSVQEVAKDIKSFVFEPAEPGETLPEFSAGSHIQIYLPSGGWRFYSLVNPPYESNKYQVAVKREAHGKGGSKEMHQISAGDVLEISAPRNNFVLYENRKKFLLISGGIGITPLLSMAHRLDETDQYFELHICAKDKAEVPFQYELENWSFAPNVEIHIDKDGRPAFDPQKVLSSPDPDTLIYVCGPPGFNKWIRESAVKMGWKEDQIRQEFFSAPPVQVAETRAFELELKKSDKTITVKKEQTIIDALHFNNIKVPYSCLQGTCGTCVMEVEEGEIDHRDAVLSEEEKAAQKKICLCVSRAMGEKLAVDL